MVTYLGSLVQLCCGEGGTLQTNIAGMCGKCSQCFRLWDHPGFAPAHSSMCFPGPHCSGCRVLCRTLSKAGPGFCALPRSKLLGFRFSGMPQGHRLGGACVLCPSPVRAAQVTRCLASCDLSPPLSLLLGFLGVQLVHLLRWAMCLFWGADLWLGPSRHMSTIQNPKKSWLAMKPACSLVEDASLGLRLPPSSSGCPSLPVSSWGWAGLQLASSAQSFVL